MSCGNSGTSASDIITYIGIPLAVAGILPILYNTIATLVILQKLKKNLKHSGLSAVAIRSDVVNRIIELELPRYKLATFDRNDPRYWAAQPQTSNLPGGTWTALVWRTNHVATKTQRFQYADEVKQPQAEADFEQLVWYLLDLGAVPDPKGWKVLRASSVWTPKDQRLMTSPDGHHNVLTVASLDGSDGHLSLKLHWSPSWKNKRSPLSISLHMVRLPGNRSPLREAEMVPDHQKAPDLTNRSSSPDFETSQGDEGPGKGSPDISEKQGNPLAREIDCELSVEGLLQVRTDGLSLSNIDHLRIGSGSPNGVWFASMLAAYASAGQAITSYVVPDAINRFALQATVPCGVLILLGLAEESEVPIWTTEDDEPDEAAEFLRARDEQHLAMRAARTAREHQEDVFYDSVDRNLQERQQLERAETERLRLEQTRNDTREQQALQSTGWHSELVANHSLPWLKSCTLLPSDSTSTLPAVGAMILHRMISDVAFASLICQILDRWKAWSDNGGGMKRPDLAALQQKPEVFAQAAILVALVRAAALGGMGSVLADLHKCIEAHKTVRLG